MNNNASSIISKVWSFCNKVGADIGLVYQGGHGQAALWRLKQSLGKQ